MQEILKLLNDHASRDLAELNDEELHRFEDLCENWRSFAEAERAGRASLPRRAASAGAAFLTRRAIAS